MEKDIAREVKAYYGRIIDKTEIVYDSATGNDKAHSRITADQYDELMELLESMGNKWERRFTDKAEEFTEKFFNRVGTTTRRQLFNEFKKHGFTVDMDLSPRMQDVIRQITRWSTDLIKTIPRGCLRHVQKMVVRSVEAGRDIGGLEKELATSFDITQKRARMIAKDQSNKATQGIAVAQCQDNGIHQGIWRHNAASKHWRKHHVQMDGEVFDLNLGCFDPVEGRYIMPAELVNCHCSFRPKIDVGVY
jgi:uncharacterized protein with gpF-like domain